MTRVLTKKAMLEYLGKDGKDTRWVDRAISKGIVWHDVDTGGYILCTEYIEELEEENIELKVKSGELEGYVMLKEGKPDLGVWHDRYLRLKDEYDKLKESSEGSKEDKVDKNVDQGGNKEKIKDLEEKNKGLMDAYVKALRRLKVKDEFIGKMILKMKSKDDPKGFRDIGDYTSSVYDDLEYDPRDDNYL